MALGARSMKRIDIDCPLEIKEIITAALRDYTEVAFPPDGTDCVLVARESMLDAVRDLEREYSANNDGTASYNKRLRAMAKEAIKLHYQLASAEHGRSFDHECALLLDVVSGIAHDGNDLLRARAADQAD